MALMYVYTGRSFFLFHLFCLFVVQNIHIHSVLSLSYIGAVCKILQLLFYLH